MADDPIDLDELISHICDIKLEKSNFTKTNDFPPFWANMFDANYNYHIYPKYADNLESIFSIIHSHIHYKPFIILDNLEQVGYIDKHQLNTHKYNIVELDKNCAKYIHRDKKCDKYIMYFNIHGKFYPISCKNKFEHDDVKNIEHLIDLHKLKINKIKLTELQDICKLYDIKILNEKGKKIKKAILFENIMEKIDSS